MAGIIGSRPTAEAAVSMERLVIMSGQLPSGQLPFWATPCFAALFAGMRHQLMVIAPEHAIKMPIGQNHGALSVRGSST
jgi:hypothetical protein